MNILGYISAILILIAIAFQAYYANWFFDRSLQNNYRGYHCAYRDLEKKCIKEKFSRLPEKKPSSKKDSPASGEEKVFTKKECTPYCMRLNLWELTNGNDEHLLLIFEKLLSYLYGDILLDQKEVAPFAKKILQALVQKQKEGFCIHLEQLVFKNEKNQKIYYKMLKGKDSLYPCLLKYVKFEENKKNTLCLACADKTILQCLFNKKIAEILCAKKQDPLHQLRINRIELEKLLTIYGNASKQNVFPYISLKHRRKALKEITITTREKQSGIYLEQTIPLNSRNVGNKKWASKS